MNPVLAAVCLPAPRDAMPAGSTRGVSTAGAPRVSFASLLLGSAPVACAPAGRSTQSASTGTRLVSAAAARAGDAPPGAHDGSASPDDDPHAHAARRRAPTGEPLQPGWSHLAACLAPPVAQQAPAAASPQARAAVSLEDLMPAMVRRIAWSGDRDRGTVRLEIAAGELDGATLLVHAAGGRVRVQLDVPAGIDARRWQQRIERRLASRGVPVDAVEVT